MERLVNLFGLVVLIGIAWALSTNRKQVNWGLVLKGIALQLLCAFLVLRTPWGRPFFAGARQVVIFVLDASKAGTEFVFGALANETVFGQAMGDQSRWGFIFFVQVTGTIILVSSLMAALYYVGIMQRIVWAMAKLMQVVMGLSGSESLAAAANVFVGQTEAPLVIRPYLERMTRSELMALMTGGMATIAGGVMAAYVGMLKDEFPDIAGHLLAASVMSAPAALVLAKIMVPETEQSETMGTVPLDYEKNGYNLIDAICRGASEGLRLSLNVMAMLVAFIALIYLCNAILSGVGRLFGVPGLTLEQLFGYVGAPLALVLGVPPRDALTVGQLLAERTILNEFVAYSHLAEILQSGSLSERSTVISTYALCGFANFSSIAIQVGGIGVLVPNRIQDLAELGLRAMLAGTLACFMTATIAGVLV